MTLGSTQPLTELSTMNFPGGKGRPARNQFHNNSDAKQARGPNTKGTRRRRRRRRTLTNSDYVVLATLDRQFQLVEGQYLHRVLVCVKISLMKL
jgi:hypothetical protein